MNTALNFASTFSMKARQVSLEPDLWKVKGATMTNKKDNFTFFQTKLPTLCSPWYYEINLGTIDDKKKDVF